ncbi:SH3 domain-containing protein [Galactobacter caseinivorans]|uniref:SH3 domain-containing protein n=1 Tax=Galactobacter caseinivorans TaxID=2676123 RepID=A0A496PJG3_9MICC|nr:SH3 domain-containing protein [Galactobacter caseinivorans]RKW70643.1 SH3 domain-containing protein [Galactobacter caseinivorans]
MNPSLPPALTGRRLAGIALTSGVFLSALVAGAPAASAATVHAGSSVAAPSVHATVVASPWAASVSVANVSVATTLARTAANKSIRKTTLKTTAALKLRKGRSTKTARLATLPKGTKVTSTLRAGNGWYRVSHKGKTGYVSPSYVKVLSVAPAQPAPKKKAAKKKATPGSFSKLKVGSNLNYQGLKYSVLNGGVNKKRPVGLMMYLDGDYYPGYKGAVSNSPTGSKAKAMAKVAAKRNMLLVMPKHVTAGYTRSMGYTWWYKSGTTAGYIKRLDSYLRSTGGISKSNVWYMGYSGGAEYITYELAKRSQDSYGYGGTILLAGGGAPSSISKPSTAFRTNFDMHWVVGSKDGYGQSSNANEWSAYKASAKGRGYFTSKGFKTTRTVLAGKNHHSYNLASVMETGFKAGKR